MVPNPKVPVGMKLMSNSKDYVSFEMKSIYTSIRIVGKIFITVPSSREYIQVATVDYKFQNL